MSDDKGNELFCRQFKLPSGTRLAFIKKGNEPPTILSESPVAALAAVAYTARMLSQVEAYAPDLRAACREFADNLDVEHRDVQVRYEDEKLKQ